MLFKLYIYCIIVETTRADYKGILDLTSLDSAVSGKVGIS